MAANRPLGDIIPDEPNPEEIPETRQELRAQRIEAERKLRIIRLRQARLLIDQLDNIEDKLRENDFSDTLVLNFHRIKNMIALEAVQK